MAAARDQQATASDKDDRLDHLDEAEGVHLASMTSKHKLGQEQLVVSVKGLHGKVLASVDSSERVKHHDLSEVARLLSDAQISSLGQPITVRLEQDNSDSYRIKGLDALAEPLGGGLGTFRRLVGGRLYDVSVCRVGGSVIVEMVEGQRGIRSVV